MLRIRSRIRRTFAFPVLIAALVAGCATGRTADATSKPVRTGRAERVAYVNYSAGAAGQRLEIVNQSHTDRADLYSKTRPLEDAITKVTTDEVMHEMIEFFRAKGFFERAQNGASPATGEGLYSQALEVETPDTHVHLCAGKNMPPAERQRFLECAQAFVMIYNDTYQLQSVDRPPDWNAEKNTAPTHAAGTKKKPGQ